MAAGALGVVLLGALSAHALTLDEAEHTATTNQPLLRAARANTAAGDARTEQARAPLLPQIKLEGLYERTTGNRAQKPGRNVARSNSFTGYNWYDAELTGNLLLWDFGQSLNRWRAAAQRAAGLGDSERATVIQVVVGVRAAFFRARAEKALVAVAGETLANQARHLTQIQGFVEAGARPQIDLVQARADMANVRVQLIAAQNGYAVARASLNQAMGVTGGTDYDVADQTLGPVDGEEMSTPALIDAAVRARPDVAALDAQVRAQQLTARAARGAYFPTLSLIGGAFDAGSNLVPKTVPNPPFPATTYGLAWNLFAGLQLTWPLFQGFLTRGQVREADATLDGISAQRDALVQQVWVGVQQAALGVRAAKEAVVAADDALVNANERLRLAEGRYTAGAGSIIELDDAQLSATRAAAQRVGAEYDLAAARAELLAALGRR
jgi:outer membrane protein